MDLEVLQVILPTEEELSKLVSTSKKQYKERLENANQIPEVEEAFGPKGTGFQEPIELKSSEWVLNVVLRIGGRIISMMHIPSGIQWPHSRLEINGYEEYSNTKYRSAGSSEEYCVIELVCLRVHSTFNLLNPSESFVSFTSIDGSIHEVSGSSLINGLAWRW